MVFRFSYFEESHHIQLQIKIAIWLQTEILQILYQTKNFLKALSHSQNSSKDGDLFIFLQYLANIFQIRKYIYIYLVFGRWVSLRCSSDWPILPAAFLLFGR